MVRIPSEYQEVEYLASNGTQWIDTGTVLNNGCVITIDFLIEESTDNRIVYGWRRKGTYANSYQASIGANQNKARYVSFGVHSSIGNPSLEYGHAFEYGVKNRIVIDSENKHILVNGVVIDCNENFDNGNAFNAGGSSEYNPYLFAMNNAGKRLSMTRNTKIYAYSVEYENEFSQNFIPCYRKSDNKPGMYDTVSGEFYVNSGTGEFLVGNNVYYDTTNLLESRRRILLTTPHLESPTPANPLTFKSNMSAKLKEGKVYFTPMQEGEGDPSPDNVRPITGWDGITVTRTGKNLFSGEQIWKLCTPYASISEDENGRYVTPGSVLDFINFPDGIFKEKTQYTFIMKTYASIEVAFYVVLYSDGSNSSITAPVGLNTFAFVTAAGKTVKGIRPMNRSATRRFYYEESGVFEGNLTTDTYEPYQGSTITIPFPKTIYGGYVDLVNGEVVEEYTAVTLDGENVKVNRGDYSTTNFYGAGWVYATPRGLSTNSRKIYVCDRLPTRDSTSTVLHLEASWTGSLYYRIRVIPKSDYPDKLTNKEVIDLTNDWLKTNPVTVAYPLATPIHHTIDPQVIRPLKGVNNIWSDANGNIEIKFWKH